MSPGWVIDSDIANSENLLLTLVQFRSSLISITDIFSFGEFFIENRLAFFHEGRHPFLKVIGKKC